MPIQGKLDRMDVRVLANLSEDSIIAEGEREFEAPSIGIDTSRIGTKGGVRVEGLGDSYRVIVALTLQTPIEFLSSCRFVPRNHLLGYELGDIEFDCDKYEVSLVVPMGEHDVESASNFLVTYFNNLCIEFEHHCREFRPQVAGIVKAAKDRAIETKRHRDEIDGSLGIPVTRPSPLDSESSFVD